MDLLIVEDEAPAAERLRDMLHAARPEATLHGPCASVAEALAWLAAHRPPDLAFLDIQLADGPSFEIVRHGALACPVIFTTAYDAYVLAAFEANGIDYLLKPLRAEHVERALARYDQLRDHFTRDLAEVLARLPWRPAPAFRSRFLVRKGAEWLPLAVEEIAYFVSAQKLTFAVVRGGQRFLLDEPLAAIEAAVDPLRFFRLNRQVLAQVQGVRRVRSVDKGKLEVALDPDPGRPVTVSEERASSFRTWLAGGSGYSR